MKRNGCLRLALFLTTDKPSPICEQEKIFRTEFFNKVGNKTAEVVSSLVERHDEWWPHLDLNQGSLDYESIALTAMLWGQLFVTS